MIPVRPLGKTGLMVAQLAFGTLTISPLQCDLSPQRSAELITYAFDKGITLFDTAELYDTYEPLRLALKHRPDIQVSTKSYAWDHATAQKAFDDARRSLDKDVIDIFMLHEQESLYTMRGHREAFDFYLEQKAKGLIKAVGMSTHRVEVVHYAPRYGGVDVLHPLINKTGIGIGDGTKADMETACYNAWLGGIGIFAMKPLGGGHLLKDPLEAFQYVMSKPYLDCVACGMQSEAEIDMNCAIFAGEVPSTPAVTAAAKAPRRLFIHDYCQGCGKCVARCGQHALSLQNGQAQVDLDRCVRCGYCASVCPEFCIKVI